MKCKATNYQEGTYGIHSCNLDAGHKGEHTCCGHKWENKTVSERKQPPNAIYLQHVAGQTDQDLVIGWTDKRYCDTDVKYVLASEYETLQKMYRDAMDALYHSTVKYWALTDELSMLRSRIPRPSDCTSSDSSSKAC